MIEAAAAFISAPASSNSPPTTATGEELLPVPSMEKDERPAPSPYGMRRNLTATAALSAASVVQDEGLKEASSSGMRRNTSASTLSDLRRREQQQSSKALEGSAQAVVEAVACKLLEQVLGKAGMLGAMRENMQSIPEGKEGGGTKEGGGSSGESSSASEGGDDKAKDGGGGGGGSSSGSAAAGAAAGSTGPSGVVVPPGISQALQGYIHTIVRHLELPNSCIVAALIYVMRAVSGTRFALSLTNWQPCLLAAFVIAAKLSFDEPVWNEDFVKALRISNVQVSQISRWEADFLQLLSFNTNVTVAQYAAMCFELQKAHEDLHQKPCHFFTYLMALSTPS